MIATFLIAVAALLVAVIGCAWLKPVGANSDEPMDEQPDLDPDEVASGR
jgi:hypothetical protein